jgi:hypothetical protein
METTRTDDTTGYMEDGKMCVAPETGKEDSSLLFDPLIEPIYTGPTIQADDGRRSSGEAPKKDGKVLPDWVLESAPNAATFGGLLITFVTSDFIGALNPAQRQKVVSLLVGVLMRAPSKATDIVDNVLAFSAQAKSFTKVMSVLNVLGALVAVVDIGMNVFSIIGEMGKLSPAASAYDGAIRTTNRDMHAAKGTAMLDKGDFLKAISDYVSDGYKEFSEDRGTALANAMSSYRTSLKGAVDRLGDVLKVVTNIASAIVSIAADIGSIISLFLGVPAGLVCGLISGGVTFLNWVIQNFDLDDKTVDTFTSWVNGRYIPSLWGANISSETIYADMYL